MIISISLQIKRFLKESYKWLNKKISKNIPLLIIIPREKFKIKEAL